MDLSTRDREVCSAWSGNRKLEIRIDGNGVQDLAEFIRPATPPTLADCSGGSAWEKRGRRPT